MEVKSAADAPVDEASLAPGCMAVSMLPIPKPHVTNCGLVVACVAEPVSSDATILPIAQKTAPAHR